MQRPPAHYAPHLPPPHHTLLRASHWSALSVPATAQSERKYFFLPALSSSSSAVQIRIEVAGAGAPDMQETSGVGPRSRDYQELVTHLAVRFFYAFLGHNKKSECNAKPVPVFLFYFWSDLDNYLGDPETCHNSLNYFRWTFGHEGWCGAGADEAQTQLC